MRGVRELADELEFTAMVNSRKFDEDHPLVGELREAAAALRQGYRTVPLTFHQKTAINKRFQELYDAGMRRGNHGHYETMFAAMHNAYEEFLNPSLKGRNLNDATGSEWK